MLPMIHRLAELLLDQVLEQQPEDHDRQRADDDEPAHARVRPPPGLRAEERRAPTRADPSRCPAEVEDHRELGADLDHRR